MSTGRVTRAVWDARAAAVGISWVGDEPVSTYPPKAKRRARCLTCAHEWDAYPASIQQGRGCPECSRPLRGARRLTPEEWDRRAAAVGVEWTGERPRRTSDKRPARCLSCGCEWEANPANIAIGRTGCPTCAKQARADGRAYSRDEWDERAAAVGVEWIGDEPVRTTSTRRARCLTCGCEWDARPKAIYGGHGCPSCAGNAPRDRAVWDERAAAVGVEWIGDEAIRGHTPRRARCLACAHEWDVLPGNVRKGQGCPVCAPGGLDPTAPSSVYLVALLDRGLVKVGVMNRDTQNDRLRTHARRGWELVARWDVADGREALRVESAVLDWWRESGAVFATSDEVPAGDGYTEAAHGVDVPAALAYVEGLLRG